MRLSYFWKNKPIKKAVPKLFAILLFLFVLKGNFFAQRIEKDLVKKVWYCSCNFKSDSLVLFADNTSNPNSEVRFSTTGKLILKNLKKRSTDSSFTYLIRKKSVILRSNQKDSVKTLNYEVKKIAGKKAYQFSMKFSSRYTKRKGDDTIAVHKFTLAQGKKRKTIELYEELAVFSQKRALRNDSINRAVWGIFVGYIADTLLIDSDQFVEHNFYKKYTDTLHYIAPLLLDTIVRIKVPVKEITGIYSQREPLSTVTTNATLLALATGLVCVSASLMGGESSAGSVFGQAGVISFLTIPISFGINMLFSKQKFLIKAGKESKKVWAFDRRMPRTVVTQRNKKFKLKK